MAPGESLQATSCRPGSLSIGLEEESRELLPLMAERRIGGDYLGIEDVSVEHAQTASDAVEDFLEKLRLACAPEYTPPGSVEGFSDSPDP